MCLHDEVLKIQYLFNKLEPSVFNWKYITQSYLSKNRNSRKEYNTFPFISLTFIYYVELGNFDIYL